LGDGEVLLAEEMEVETLGLFAEADEVTSGFLRELVVTAALDICTLEDSAHDPGYNSSLSKDLVRYLY
jgi:hypothetical protein